MTNRKLNAKIATIVARIDSLTAEKNEAYTKNLGTAAVNGVQETINTYQDQLALVIVDKATQCGKVQLSKFELEVLYTVAERAMVGGKELGYAFVCVDTLVSQAKAGNCVPDMLVHPNNTVMGKLHSQTIQGLGDRVEALNHYVARR